jgi:hypothetical protein
MTNEVIIYNISADRALALKHQIVADGLQPTIDFIWEFTPVTHNNWARADSDESFAKYTFDDPALASFYRLKWAR